MITIKTKTGKVFPANWIGVSSLDGVLRFELTGSTLSGAMSVFMNYSETEKIEEYLSGTLYDTFIGYTKFSEIKDQTGGNIVVGLRKQ